MHTSLIYILTVIIWGTTWFSIKLQVGHVAPEISIFYRYVIASTLLLIWCKSKKISLRFNKKDHVFLCLLGLSMFSIHYLFVFHATHYLVSGIIAVVFSGVSFFALLNNYLFFKIKPKLNVISGAMIGCAGLSIFFWDEINTLSLEDNTFYGVFLCVIGVIIFSLGGAITKRNHNHGLDNLPCMTIGMCYGTFAIFLYALFMESQFSIPTDVTYWGSMLYLSIPGTIIAFFFYMKIIKDLGPEVAGYTTVLFPIIALVVSWLFEDYQWSLYDLIGFGLVMVGNMLVLSKQLIRSKID